MGVSIGDVSAGRDANVTVFNGLPVPNDWRRRAIEAMAGLNPAEREYVDGKTRQLSRLLMNKGGIAAMRGVVSAIEGLAPNVAQVISEDMPFLVQVHIHEGIEVGDGATLSAGQDLTLAGRDVAEEE